MTSLTLDLAKLSKVLHALVEHKFVTDADVAMLFELQRVAHVTEFPPAHLVLNFQLAEADYDRSVGPRHDATPGGGAVLRLVKTGVRDRTSRDR